MVNPLELAIEERPIRVTTGATLEGDLGLPKKARGIVLFAHGSGSSRFSSRNRYVARLLNVANLATVLVDLLTADGEAIDVRTAHLRFNIGLLAERVVAATDWVIRYPATQHLPLGYFGASTGAAAALVAAAKRPKLCALSCPEAGAPIWRVRRWPTFKRRRSLSSAETTSRSYS